MDGEVVHGGMLCRWCRDDLVHLFVCTGATGQDCHMPKLVVTQRSAGSCVVQLNYGGS